ncbi:MAG: ATP-binding protein [Treponema sp.]|nr:ATP-binding protein [Treponema sp.]
MKSDPTANILLKYLRDLISNPANAAINTDELPEEYHELIKEMKFLCDCVSEARTLAKSLSKGILTDELPSRKNEIAAPLKSLHASLKHLTWQVQQIAQGDYKQRIDFMGEFSNSFNKMIEQLAERDALLKTVNHAAAALLSVNEEKSFEESLTECMEYVGNRVNVDRVHIWRNGELNGENVLFHKFEWDNETVDPKNKIPLNIHIPYQALPRWENIIKDGEIIHGPARIMPHDVQDFFSNFKIKSIAVIPLFLRDKFWGVFTLDSCKTERSFSEEEIHILQSAGLMMINAVLRNESVAKIHEEHEKTEQLAHWYQSILNAIPLPISVTDKDMKWTFINTAVEKFLQKKLKDMIGMHCSNWKSHICNTEKCGIACIKRGINQTFFSHNNNSYKTEIAMLKDLNNETTGYLEVVYDITDIEIMTKKQTEAEAASKAKSIFLANMSHEMRTPMNVILGISEIQLHDNSHPSETLNAFGRIYESGDLLLNIINDILDLSKIEAGKMELNSVNYDIPSLINDTAQLNRLRYESSPIGFTLQVDENTPHNLFGDELRIKQILNNILSNAFKYTEVGSIDFSVASEPGQDDNVIIIFVVKDTGQGMTEIQIVKMFEEYTRFNADANRETVGTGLGMSITKRLVDLMNGTITVKSTPGKGSEFTVRIPQKQIGTAKCGAELADKIRNFRFQSMAIAKKAQFMREYMPYGSVLVVDDVISNIYVAKGILSPYSLNIDTASSGFEAIEKIKNGSIYDIIFMDHMMPKLDGIEATKVIRSMGYSNTIIALTANAIIAHEKVFFENGFDGFISKPIDSRELNHILNEFIRNKKPIDVIEAARKEQQEKDKKNTADNAIDENTQKMFFIEDANNAINILEKLCEKTENFNDEEIKLYIITVHGIKSVLANIGEKGLSAFALKLEHAGDDHNYNVIKKETPALINALQSLINKFKLLKEEANQEEVKTITNDDVMFLHENLEKIKTACTSFDKISAKEALEELKKKAWSQEINTALDEIAMHILHSAFKKAAATANSVCTEKINLQR